ncbi:MAG: hypothetical protein KatS3mg029_0126 [Saprospiraceae bacterium]|nr:MAG: hypothetical protein KatS3mg029_0126 [Saprospiraceae bacterium]
MQLLPRISQIPNATTGWLLTLAFAFTVATSYSQEGFEAGGWLGMSHYFGDLNTNMRIDHPGLAGGLALRYNFNPRIALKLSGNTGTVAAYDADSPNIFERARNLHFKSRVADAALQLEFNFLEYLHGSKDQFWTPYLFLGMGVSYFNPKAKLDGTWYELRPLGTEGQFKGEEYYTVSGGWVYGMGLKVDLSYEWSINIELSSRRLFTDYLDDVSTVYPDPGDVENIRGEFATRFIDRSPELYAKDPEFFMVNQIEYPIGEPGRQRGNSKTRDTYVYFSVGFFYYFGDIKCPYGR